MKVIKMTDLLIDKCIRKFNIMLETCKNRSDCDELPHSLVIQQVKASKSGWVYTAKKVLAAWRYENGSLMQIPTDAKPVQKTVSGELFCEGLAQFGLDKLRNKAFINVFFGERISMGFEYDMSAKGTSFTLDNEIIGWEK